MQFHKHATKTAWNSRWEHRKDFMDAFIHTDSMTGKTIDEKRKQKQREAYGEPKRLWLCNELCISRCFFRGSGGTVNVLRISGTQGYPECGTQRVRQFKVDHISISHSIFTCIECERTHALPCHSVLVCTESDAFNVYDAHICCFCFRFVCVFSPLFFLLFVLFF